MRTGVTLVDITRAADQLLADGERPTIDGIRKVLGTGSPATVNALLKEYYQALPGRLNLPAPIAIAAAELYEKVRATAMEEVSEQRVALEREIALEREQIAQDRRAFDSERTTLKSQVVTLTANVEQLQEQQRGLSGRAAALEKDLASQAARAAGAEAQVRAADEERERTALKQTSEVQRLREQADGNERHLLSRIEEHKTQYQRLHAERERDVAAATKRVSTLETAVSEAAKAHASLRAELASAQRDVLKRSEAATAAENALQRLQDESLRDAAAHMETLERARADLDRAVSTSEQIRRERDDAIREAARLEGRMQGLHGQLVEVRAELSRLQHLKGPVNPGTKGDESVRDSHPIG